MPRPRFNNLSDSRRRELLEAAASEFAIRGPEGASLNSIIAGVGLSKGTFYYYFDDKADLFDAVLLHCQTIAVGDSVYSLDQLDKTTFWPRLEEWTLTMTARMQELPWLGALGKAFYGSPEDDDLKQLVGDKLEEARGWLSALLQHGREVGAVRFDEPLGLQRAMIAGAVEGSDRWFVDHWDEFGSENLEDLVKIVFGIAKRMAAPPEESVPTK